MGRRHLFLAAAKGGFGEILMGLHLAGALHDAGEGVSFLYPESLAHLFVDAPFAHGRIDRAGRVNLATTVHDLVRRHGFATVTLVDVLSVLGTVGGANLRQILETLPGRLLGIDMWNLPETDLTWDAGDGVVRFDPVALAIPAVRPCPIARPEATGACRALPPDAPLAPEERARVRRELGIGAEARVVLVTTATWQLPVAGAPPASQRLALAMDDLFALYLRRLPGAHLVHVGPAPFAWGGGDPRYTHLPPLPPPRFREVLGAADLLLSVNVLGTTVAQAIGAGIPTAVVTSSRSVASLEELGPCPDDLRAWIGRALPLPPFRVYPFGLHRFLEPVLHQNPYAETFVSLELLDLDAGAERLRGLLDDPARALTAARAAYLHRVAELPTALARFQELSAPR